MVIQYSPPEEGGSSEGPIMCKKDRHCFGATKLESPIPPPCRSLVYGFLHQEAEEHGALIFKMRHESSAKPHTFTWPVEKVVNRLLKG